MHSRFVVASLLACLSLNACNRDRAVVVPASQGGPVIDHAVQTIDGKSASLAAWRGKAVLVVNTASECGYTPQYGGLQTLHERYKDRGFEVLGFPCDDFGGQEPGSATEIQAFCSGNFHITFPLFAKVHAKGPQQAPLYKTLTEATPEGIRGPVKWNFTKFLVDPQGKVVARFEPGVEPLDPRVVQAVEQHLPTP